MSLTSPFFVAFLALTFLVYYSPPARRAQPLVLLSSGLLFYACLQPAMVILLLASILTNATVSFQIARGPASRRITYAITGICLNLGVLVAFKYSGMLGDLLSVWRSGGRPQALDVLASLGMPLGLSFYTFQGIGLLLDILRNRALPTTSTTYGGHVVRTALFLSFFPTITSGPILRSTLFYSQIGSRRLVDVPWERVFRAVVLGVFLKSVVADNLHPHTLSIAFPHFLNMSLASGVVLTFGYSIQMFADFSGYSLTAAGVAMLFGYRIPRNFDFPYIARSLSEFWRRWHMSLSTWLRDYLYVPLGGNRRGNRRTYLNLLIVMVLGGLWHGPTLGFAIWGGYHGIGLVVERWLVNRVGPIVPESAGALFSGLRVLGVFSFVSFGWLLFKLPDAGEFANFMQALWTNRHLPLSMVLAAPIVLFSLPVLTWHASASAPVRAWREGLRRDRPALHQAVTCSVYGILLFLIVVQSGSGSDFIYAQF